LISLILSPILEAESGCKGKATFSNFQIFFEKFSTFFFTEPFCSRLEAKAVAKVMQVFQTSKSF